MVKSQSQAIYLYETIYTTFCYKLLASRAQPLFWIDAICIDQSSVQERNLQVQHMGAVYQGARKVLICLGNDLLVTEVFAFANINLQRPIYRTESARSVKDEALVNAQFYESSILAMEPSLLV